MSNNFENELADLEKRGLRRSFYADFTGVNFSSNDYLGLSTDPRVQKAAIEAVQQYGTGGTSSRLLAGTFDLHKNLEKDLSEFFSKEAALVFSSGYHANAGILPVLAGAGDIIFMDRLCHASIVDGVKLSDARFATFEHNNLNDLRRQLSERRSKYRRAWIATEGIFSMDGDRPDLKFLANLAKEYDALIYLDDAHAIGVTGPDGKGWAAEEGVLENIDVLVGTLSKSLASQGGFVTAKRSMIDLLVSRSRSFIYTTALAPAAAGAALAALHLLPALVDRRAKLKEWGELLRKELSCLGFDVGLSQSQIIPVLTGDIETTRELSAHLLSHGFFVPSIRPPTVPAGEGRVRLSLTHPVLEKGKHIVGAFASFSKCPQRKKEKVV